MTSRPLHLLPGIGPKTAGWLREVGIADEVALRRIGAAAAWRRLKHWNQIRVSRNALWALYGALNGVAWNRIDAETRKALLIEAGEQP